MGEMRRRFTKEYKVEAVRLATVGDKSLAQVARELGLRSDVCASGNGTSRRRPAPRRRFRPTVARQEQRRSSAAAARGGAADAGAGLPQKAEAYFTYIPTAQDWLYLAVVLDLASRRVESWSMRENLTSVRATMYRTCETFLSRQRRTCDTF